MRLQILIDASYRPDLFHWIGPLQEAGVSTWLASRVQVLPDGLVDFYVANGGGEVFESEEILPPDDGPYGIDRVTATFRSKDLPNDLVVFHTGTWVSVLEVGSGSILVLDNFAEIGRTRSFDSWYRQWIRGEYFERYGLPELVDQSDDAWAVDTDGGTD